MDWVIEELTKLAYQHHADKLVLFGSRARGDATDRSDYDIAVSLPKSEQTAFWTAVDNLDTLYKIDLVFLDDHTDPALLSNIQKDGVILMSKFLNKYENFKKATSRLGETLEEYKTNPSDSIRDGAIQRFEFTVELAWKTIREYLVEQGLQELNTPRAVLKEAFAAKVIDDEPLWMDMIKDRNLTSHVYDEDTAGQIYSRLGHYHAAFKQLIQKLQP